MKRWMIVPAVVLALAWTLPVRAQEAVKPNPLSVLKVGGVPNMRAPEAVDLLLADCQAPERAEATINGLVGLMSENRDQTRILAAMTLARAALQGPADEKTAKLLLNALTHCFNDSASGVRYWGLQGLLAPGLREGQNLEALLRRALDVKRQPVALSVIALEAVRKEKLERLVPQGMRVLKAAAADHEKLRLRLLSRKTEGAPGAEAPAAGGLAPLEGPGPGMGPGPGGMAPGGEAPVGPAGVGPAAASAADGGTLLDVTKLDVKALQELAQTFDEQEEALLLRRAGLALERLTDQKWGFGTAMPWNMLDCVAQAEGWLRAANKAGKHVLPPDEDATK